ncbi:MAG: hypothetical protein ACFFEF_17780 [Candidatus Thorarchaeota archaeon]
MAFDLGQYLQIVHDRFQHDNFQLRQDTVADVDVTVATMQEFKWSWMATKMHFFGIYGVSGEVTKADIERFSAEAFQFAHSNYTGIGRGLQSGFGSLSALITTNATQEAKNWVANFTKKHFASFEVPVLVDLSTLELVYCRKKPLWGRIYYGRIHDFIERYYRPHLGAI